MLHLTYCSDRLAGRWGDFGRRVMHCFIGLLSISSGTVLAQHDAHSPMQDSLQLDELVVKGIHGEKKTNILTPTDKVLESTPGITMIRRGNFAMEPAIRSLNNGQITTTIDGMRIFGACTDRMDPVSSYIEPNNLSGIAITENAGENQVGSSVGGGINFKLKEPEFSNERTLSGSAGSGYETNGNAMQGFAGVTITGQNTALQIDGIYRRSGNYKAGGGDAVLFSQYEKWNGHLAGKVRVGKNAFIKGDYLQDEGYNIGYPALPMDVAFAKAKIASVAFVSENPETNTRWETKLYYNFIDHAMDDTKRPKSMVPIHMDMPGTSRTAGFYSTFSQTLRKKHHIQARVDGFNNELSATMTMYPDGASEMFMYTLPDLGRSGIGAAVNDHISLTALASVRLSGRMEWLHDYQFSQAGKEQLSGIYPGDLSRDRLVGNLGAGMDYQLSERNKLSLDVSRGARAATLQEGYGFYIFNRTDGFDYMGNPDLKQETSVNLNLTYQYKSSRFSASVNPFVYFFRNYIVGALLPDYSVMTIGAYGVKRYENIGSARLYGASLNLVWSPVSDLKLSSNNTYTEAKDRAGNWLPLIAPFRSVNTINYQLKAFSFSAEAVLNGAQKKTSPEVYGEQTTPSSAIFNLNAARTFTFEEKGLLRLFAGVDNLFDNKYFQHLDVQKVPRPGRNVVVRATFSF